MDGHGGRAKHKIEGAGELGGQSTAVETAEQIGVRRGRLDAGAPVFDATLDHPPHRLDVGRPADVGVARGLEELARVAGGHGTEHGVLAARYS